MKHRGFNRCKLDVDDALQAAGWGGGGRQSKDGSREGSSGVCNGANNRGSKMAAQRRGAERRLHRVVGCADALELLHTLTAET